MFNSITRASELRQRVERLKARTIDHGKESRDFSQLGISSRIRVRIMNPAQLRLKYREIIKINVLRLASALIP